MTWQLGDEFCAVGAGEVVRCVPGLADMALRDEFWCMAGLGDVGVDDGFSAVHILEGWDDGGWDLQ
jgi:hypothetical protein